MWTRRGLWNTLLTGKDALHQGQIFRTSSNIEGKRILLLYHLIDDRWLFWKLLKVCNTFQRRAHMLSIQSKIAKVLSTIFTSQTII
jgi:hypothetical protein